MSPVTSPSLRALLFFIFAMEILISSIYFKI
jgi:hypothetical protein